jgi:hypothetical protein
MDALMTLLSSMGAVVFIVLGLMVQSGLGTSVVTKLDRMFEQRFASRAIILDADDRRKRDFRS